MAHSILFASKLSQTEKMHFNCSARLLLTGQLLIRRRQQLALPSDKVADLWKQTPPRLLQALLSWFWWLLSPPVPQILCNLCQLMLEVKPPSLSDMTIWAGRPVWVRRPGNSFIILWVKGNIWSKSFFSKFTPFFKQFSQAIDWVNCPNAGPSVLQGDHERLWLLIYLWQTEKMRKMIKVNEI